MATMYGVEGREPRAKGHQGSEPSWSQDQDERLVCDCCKATTSKSVKECNAGGSELVTK